VGLRGLGPTQAVSYTYAIPALAVFIGALFLGEPISAWLAAGGVLILAGVALAQRARGA
jgi:drug/metabolite transporter (DMT)-like permease